MKHTWSGLIGALAVLTAITAAAALAATINETGHVKGAPKSLVTLKVITRGKAPVKVTQFGVRGAPATCQGGPPTASVAFPKALTVGRDRRFKGQATLSGHGITGSFKLAGTVAKNGRSASGTLNIDKRAPLPIGDCKTGKRSWSARAG